MAGRIAYLGNIVTQGLVLNLDAAIQGSYPKTGSTWFDISNNGNNGTLVNGPTFSSDNAGSIIFDGADDSVNITYNSTFNIRSGITLCVLLRRNSIFTQLSDGHILSRPPAWYFYDAYNSGDIRGEVFIDGVRRGARSISMPNDGKWYEFVYTYDSSTGWSIMYRNGVLASSIQVTGLSNYLIDSSNADFLPIFFNNTGKSYFVSNLKIYNRALTNTEITQNFNAYRTRYGI